MKASDYRAAARQTLSGNMKPAVIATLVLVAISLGTYIVSSVFTKITPLSEYASGFNSLFSIFLLLPLEFAFIIVFYNFAKDNTDNRLTDNLFAQFKANYRRSLPSMFLFMMINMLIFIIPFIIALVIVFITFTEVMYRIVGYFAEGTPYIPDILTVLFISNVECFEFMLLFFVLLFVACIPSMIYSYRVALFPLLLAQNPGMGIRDSFRRSAELTKGHKWQLFCLDISFIGWFILCIFTLGIGLLWLVPYQQTTRSLLYSDLLKTSDIE